MSEFLTFNRSELVFTPTENRNNRYESSLTIRNSSENYLGFQIKGNNVARYMISCKSGRIEPLSSVEIIIKLFLQGPENENAGAINDKFCVFYTVLEEDEKFKTNKQLLALLKERRNQRNIHAKKIRSRIQVNNNTMPNFDLLPERPSNYTRIPSTLRNSDIDPMMYNSIPLNDTNIEASVEAQIEAHVDVPHTLIKEEPIPVNQIQIQIQNQPVVQTKEEPKPEPEPKQIPKKIEIKKEKIPKKIEIQPEIQPVAVAVAVEVPFDFEGQNKRIRTKDIEKKKELNKRENDFQISKPKKVTQSAKPKLSNQRSVGSQIIKIQEDHVQVNTFL